MNVERVLYPEFDAGGFSRNNKRLIFYSRVNALLQPHMRVLEFGAGRGKFSESGPAYLRDLGNFKGRCKYTAGVDISRAVLENPFLDEAFVIEPGESLPFDDAYFDLIISWDVFEHIEDPDFCASELSRVLKRGGWICAQTPNKWGYVGIGARLVPNAFHVSLLTILGPEKEEKDTFDTLYRMNTLRAIRTLFPDYTNHSYIFTGPPSYHANLTILARLIVLYNWLMPEFLGQTLHIFLQKQGLSI